MFCPKCGVQNPENGKFCRSCGTDLGNVSQALSGRPAQPVQVMDRKGRPVSYEGAIVKFFSGVAFLTVCLALAFSGSGRGWWFWLLFPAFGSLGAGISQYFQLRRAERGNTGFTSVMRPELTPPVPDRSLPPTQTEYVSPESRYKTGDLVPPSVTDTTTRHLEMDTEGKTMSLPKK